MNTFYRRILIALFLLIFAQPGFAQALQRQKIRPSQKPPTQQQAPPELADPPYQSRLDRLSEILGALHYLGPLCRSEEKSIWRESMLSLLDAENPTQTRRERMIASFNRTYSGFKENYRSCTLSAKLARERYREEGVRLSRDLTSRFTD
jgi:uncharacterized protein (TIGR02301 family)